MFLLFRCQQRYICIQSALAKVSSKSVNEKDIDKFQLYHEFSCNIKNIQHHQVQLHIGIFSLNFTYSRGVFAFDFCCLKLVLKMVGFAFWLSKVIETFKSLKCRAKLLIFVLRN